MTFKSIIVSLIILISFTQAAEARMISVQGGIGNWYGDDLKTSFSYGGGLLFRPGVQWFEFSFMFTRNSASVQASDPLFAVLDGDNLNSYTFAATFPLNIELKKLHAYMYPLIGYVLTQNDSKTTHGFALGGGMEFILWREIVGLRFEIQEQFYKIPSSAGNTDTQSDLFGSLRLVLSY